MPSEACALEWSGSSLGAFGIAKDAKFHADSEDWSACVDAQANLSLRWAHISEGTFSHIVAYSSWKHAYIKLTPLNPTFI